MNKEYLQDVVNDILKIYQFVNLINVSGQQNVNYLAISLNSLQELIDRCNKNLQEDRNIDINTKK